MLFEEPMVFIKNFDFFHFHSYIIIEKKKILIIKKKIF